MRMKTGSSGGGRLVCCALSLCLSTLGCSKPNVPAEPDLARSSLEAALGVWKSGESTDALAQHKPPITVTDFAWKAGQKLTDFHLLGEPTSDGVNLHFQSELTLTRPQGGESTEKVGYIVGTHPVVTIFREVQ